MVSEEKERDHEIPVREKGETDAKNRRRVYYGKVDAVDTFIFKLVSEMPRGKSLLYFKRLAQWLSSQTLCSGLPLPSCCSLRAQRRE